jgi:Ras GTPase-activating-like protein IQGAP2/3
MEMLPRFFAHILHRKRFTLPFTKQSNHLRDLQRAGRVPQFGSFIYSAKAWYDKGILISIDKYSPMQFDRMEVILSSNSVGIFNIEIRNNALGISNRIAQADVKMEDLLQAQYQDRASLSLFNDQAKFHLESLLYQINKKCVDWSAAFLRRLLTCAFRFSA